MVDTAGVDIVIKRNAAEDLTRFAQLNAAWISDLHYMEESDKRMVSSPEIYTQGSNSVFSLHCDGEMAGACALKEDASGEFELTKMAVDPKFQGKGLGQLLMDAAHDYAKNALGLSRIYLLSNTNNAAALRLYARNGWTINHEGAHPVYSRCNIGMEKLL